ncbi:Crp/Fnr family transcriptional regulator [Litorimonas sp. WD9-15]|uniref:Crp/Fnr family transcriptional regulator n=1 Tax=Litorimonas sp. WD9-15 TaxID=3418716 RepID=UPI003D006088
MINERNTLSLGPVRVYPDKTSLYHQGDDTVSIYRVNSGVVMTYRLLADDERQITGFCTEGDFFGLSSDETYCDNAITVTSSGVQTIRVAEIESDPKLQRFFLSHSCKKVEDTQNLLATLTRKSSEARVAAFLVMLAERKCRMEKTVDDIRIKMPMSRTDIADYLGLFRETVSRRLTDFQSARVINLEDVHTALIPKLDSLRTCAGIAA